MLLVYTHLQRAHQSLCPLAYGYMWKCSSTATIHASTMRMYEYCPLGSGIRIYAVDRDYFSARSSLLQTRNSLDSGPDSMIMDVELLSYRLLHIFLLLC